MIFDFLRAWQRLIIRRVCRQRDYLSFDSVKEFAVGSKNREILNRHFPMTNHFISEDEMQRLKVLNLLLKKCGNPLRKLQLPWIKKSQKQKKLSFLSLESFGQLSKVSKTLNLYRTSLTSPNSHQMAMSKFLRRKNPSCRSCAHSQFKHWPTIDEAMPAQVPNWILHLECLEVPLIRIFYGWQIKMLADHLPNLKEFLWNCQMMTQMNFFSNNSWNWKICEWFAFSGKTAFLWKELWTGFADSKSFPTRTSIQQSTNKYALYSYFGGTYFFWQELCSPPNSDLIPFFVNGLALASPVYQISQVENTYTGSRSRLFRSVGRWTSEADFVCFK